MSIEIVFETHVGAKTMTWGNATDWLPSALSDRGRELAYELGRRRRDDGISAVFSSDLRRAMHTAEIAFANEPLPIFAD